jgi:protein-tyrosine kinase
MDRFTKAIEQARKSQRKDSPLSKGNFSKRIELSQDILSTNRVINPNSSNPVADSYRLLRTRTLQRMRQSDWNILGVTSTAAGAGKTLTSINLAIAIAMETNQPVILIDADLRSPSVCRTLGIGDEAGLVEYVRSGKEVSFQSFLIETSIKNLLVFPCSKRSEATSEVLTSEKMRKLFDELKSLKPSFVIVDLPPIFVGDDVVALSSYLDAALLVVEDGVTKTRDLVNAATLLDQTTLLGTVLNKSKSGQSDRYYGHYASKAET